MHSSFKVYLLTGTFCQGNGQLCQFNLSKFLLLNSFSLYIYARSILELYQFVFVCVSVILL